MKANRHKKWYKVIGGDFGAIKPGRKWVRYNCLYCIKKIYPELIYGELRWQGPPSKAIVDAMNRIPTDFKCTKNH